MGKLRRDFGAAAYPHTLFVKGTGCQPCLSCFPATSSRAEKQPRKSLQFFGVKLSICTTSPFLFRALLPHMVRGFRKDPGFRPSIDLNLESRGKTAARITAVLGHKALNLHHIAVFISCVSAPRAPQRTRFSTFTLTGISVILVRAHQVRQTTTIQRRGCTHVGKVCLCDRRSRVQSR